MIHSFFITQDGKSRSVYNDSLIDIYDQLEHERTRASTIEWDIKLGMWIATDIENGKIITMQVKRQDAVTDEIEYLNEKFKTTQHLELEGV